MDTENGLDFTDKIFESTQLVTGSKRRKYLTDLAHLFDRSNTQLNVYGDSMNESFESYESSDCPAILALRTNSFDLNGDLPGEKDLRKSLENASPAFRAVFMFTYSVSRPIEMNIPNSDELSIELINKSCKFFEDQFPPKMESEKAEYLNLILKYLTKNLDMKDPDKTSRVLKVLSSPGLRNSINSTMWMQIPEGYEFDSIEKVIGIFPPPNFQGRKDGKKNSFHKDRDSQPSVGFFLDSYKDIKHRLAWISLLRGNSANSLNKTIKEFHEYTSFDEASEVASDIRRYSRLSKDIASTPIRSLVKEAPVAGQDNTFYKVCREGTIRKIFEKMNLLEQFDEQFPDHTKVWQTKVSFEELVLSLHRRKLEQITYKYPEVVSSKIERGTDRPDYLTHYFSYDRIQEGTWKYLNIGHLGRFLKRSGPIEAGISTIKYDIYGKSSAESILRKFVESQSAPYKALYKTMYHICRSIEIGEQTDGDYDSMITNSCELINAEFPNSMEDEKAEFINNLIPYIMRNLDMVDPKKTERALKILSNKGLQTLIKSTVWTQIPESYEFKSIEDALNFFPIRELIKKSLIKKGELSEPSLELKSVKYFLDSLPEFETELNWIKLLKGMSDSINIIPTSSYESFEQARRDAAVLAEGYFTIQKFISVPFSSLKEEPRPGRSSLFYRVYSKNEIGKFFRKIGLKKEFERAYPNSQEVWEEERTFFEVVQRLKQMKAEVSK